MTEDVSHHVQDRDLAHRSLPNGWLTIRIEEIFDFWGGMTPSTAIREYWGGALPWISSKDVKNGRLSQTPETITEEALAKTRLRICRPGSAVVVVRSGVLAHSLPVAVVDRAVVINQDIKAFDSGDDVLNRWFVFYVNAMAQDILARSRREGTTVQSVKVPELVNRLIPIPPTAEEVVPIVVEK